MENNGSEERNNNAPPSAPQEPTYPTGAGDIAESGVQNRGKFLPGLLLTLLFAGALCAVAVLSPSLPGLAPGSATPAPSGGELNLPVIGSIPELYLQAQGWEKKTHDAARPLVEMKNLRYGLAFFQQFTPEQAAAVPAVVTGIGGAVTGYDSVMGRMLAIEASVTQKYPVTENLDVKGNSPSTLLALDAGQPGLDASVLVIGSQLEDVNAGDALKIRCLPLYLASTKDGASMIFFLTIPELVEKQ